MPSGEDEIAFAGLAQQAGLVCNRELSSRELVELSLRRIERLNPSLNAFREVFSEEAVVAADEADRRAAGGDAGPLNGVPIAVKDDLAIAGHVTAYGGRANATPAPADSEAVRRLRAAGAIPVGRTNAPELMIWPFTESEAFGPTRNPWDVGRTPGGSSGGSAAAVAAGLVAGATGSDGLGSIRIPAACCGIVGIKPQRNRVSWAPLREAWHGIGVIGPLARRVEDAALLLDVMTGNVPGDPPPPAPPPYPFVEAAHRAPGRLRVAISRKVPWPIVARTEAEVVDAVDATAALLRSLGHDVREADVSYGWALASAAIAMFRGVHETAAAMDRPELLERRTKGIARIGGLVPPPVVGALRRREVALAARVGRIFRDHDVVLTPVCTSAPVEVGRWEGRGAIWTFNGAGRFAPFTGAWNATGHPACAIPAPRGASGRPLGVQLVGREGDEATVIGLAAQLEAETGWVDRRPPGF